MDNLFVAISDVHVSLKTLDVSLKVLSKAIAKCEELNVPLVIGGDLNDTKAVLRAEYVKELINLFKCSKQKIFVLIGNHDLINKAGYEHSLEFLNLLPNVEVIDENQIITFNDVKIGFIPYKNTQQEMRQALDEMRSSGIKNLICHQGFFGAFMGDYVVDESSINPDELKDFDHVFSGHYHKHQFVSDNIMYFGSPFTINFSETMDEKYFWVIQKDNDRLIPNGILTNVRSHKLAVWENEKPQEPKKFDKDTILKVLLRGTKEFVLSFKKEDIQKFYDVENVCIATDIISQSEKRIEDDKVHDPIYVLDTYLLSSKTDISKGELQCFIRNIIDEHLSTNFVGGAKQLSIVNVKAENVLSFKSFEYSYEETGLTLIEGWDEDNNVSTGAGKSSFLDIPYYGLFGKTSKNLKADEVINREAKKNLLVTVTVMIDGEQYHITRTRKHSSFGDDLFITLPSGREVRGKDARETQQLINETLCVDADTFLRSTYFTQFSLIDRFLLASDTEKKNIIAEISDTKVYDEILIGVKNYLKELEPIIQKDQGQSEILRARIDSSMKHLESSKSRAIKYTADLEAEINSNNVKIANWDKGQEDKLEDIKANRIQWEEDKSDRIAHIHGKIKKFKQETLAEIDTLKENLKQKEKDKEAKLTEIEQIKSEINNVSDLAVKREKILSKLEKINLLKDKLNEEIAESNTLELIIKASENKISEEKGKIESSSHTDCPFCHQSIEAELINKKIRNIEEDIATANLELKKVSNNIKSLTEVIAIEPQLRSELDVIKQGEMVNESKKHQIVMLNGQLETIKNQIEVINKKIDEPRLCRFEIDLENIEKERNPYNKLLEQQEKQINPYLELREKLAQKAEGPNPYNEEINNIKSDIEGYLRSLGSLKESIKKATENKVKANWWKDALSIYIKSYLTDSFIDKLNRSSNEYLDKLFNGVLKISISSTTQNKSKTKEKIDVTIINGNDKCSYESLSGGERARVCLAVNLALSDIISHLSGKSFNILMLDEVLNGLDEQGKHQTMELLNDLQKKFTSIFVIDHATEFKSLFSQTINIRKNQNISRLV